MIILIFLLLCRYIDIEHLSKSLIWELEKIERNLVQGDKMNELPKEGGIILESFESSNPLSLYQQTIKSNIGNKQQLDKKALMNQENEKKWKKQKVSLLYLIYLT